MFVCDQEVIRFFDIVRNLGTRSYQIWNKAWAMQSSPKSTIYDSN